MEGLQPRITPPVTWRTKTGYIITSMRSKLDLIESRLQNLIENRFTWLPWPNRQPRLARQITEALQTQLFEGSVESQLLPNVIVFDMHPENVSAWESHPEWLKWLNQALQDTVVESGARFAAAPVIHLMSDPALSMNDLAIKAHYEQAGSGSTAALRLAQDDGYEPLEPTAVNSYLILHGGEFYPLSQAVINLGRMNTNHVVLEDLRVSRWHAQVRCVRGEWILFDLNSTGGTFVNGNRVNQYTLQPGDVISLAGVQLIYGEENSQGDKRGETTPT